MKREEIIVKRIIPDTLDDLIELATETISCTIYNEDEKYAYENRKALPKDIWTQMTYGERNILYENIIEDKMKVEVRPAALLLPPVIKDNKSYQVIFILKYDSHFYKNQEVNGSDFINIVKEVQIAAVTNN